MVNLPSVPTRSRPIDVVAGSPLELYDRPCNVFVAGFIGSPSMNFLHGELTEAGFKTADGIVLPAPVGQATSMIYGIRPEDLTLADMGIPLTVSVIEPTGAETQGVGHIGTQEVTGIFRERISARPGDVIHVRPVVQKVHLFDQGEQRTN